MPKKISLSVMVFTYLFAGIAHFVQFDYFLNIVPSFLKYPGVWVGSTGILEILFSFFLPFKVTRKWACYGILLALSISLPIDGFVLLHAGAGIPLPYWVFIVRVPFHLLLMLWAFWHALPDRTR
jgi:uncharacterized membrane protein